VLAALSLSTAPEAAPTNAGAIEAGEDMAEQAAASAEEGIRRPRESSSSVWLLMVMLGV
jgi:hypothetical protein